MPIVKSTSVNSRLISFPLLKWCRLNPYSIASIISFRRMSSRRKREKTKVRKCQSSTWKRSKPCFIQKHLTHSLNLRASVTTTVWWTLSHYCIIRNDVCYSFVFLRTHKYKYFTHRLHGINFQLPKKEWKLFSITFFKYNSYYRRIITNLFLVQQSFNSQLTSVKKLSIVLKLIHKDLCMLIALAKHVFWCTGQRHLL